MTEVTEGEDGKRLLVCPPAMFVKATVPSQGRRCSNCPRVAWVSNGMVPHVDSGEFIVVCWFCLRAKADSEEDDIVWGVHPKQIEATGGDPERIERLNSESELWKELWEKFNG